MLRLSQLDRLVTGFLQQLRIFRPRAAIIGGDAPIRRARRAPGRSPRPRRCPCCGRGQIEDRVGGRLRGLGERVRLRLELRAVGHGPVPGQSQDQPVGAGFSGDGRRNGQQALRSTLIRRRYSLDRAPVEARAHGPPGGSDRRRCGSQAIRSQTKRVRIGASAEGLRIAEKASRIFALPAFFARGSIRPKRDRATRPVDKPGWNWEFRESPPPAGKGKRRSPGYGAGTSRQSYRARATGEWRLNPADRDRGKEAGTKAGRNRRPSFPERQVAVLASPE